MKAVIAVLLLSFANFASAKEDCSLEALDLDESSNIAEILFYTGTCHYRNEDYELAVKNWSELSALKNIDPEYEELQIDTLNNLGYMKFFGYGTPEDKDIALDYWKKAVLLGHLESEYHLCHAYADKEEPTYHLAKAQKHCKKALLIYKGMEDPDDEILRQIEEYSSQVN